MLKEIKENRCIFLFYSTLCVSISKYIVDQNIRYSAENWSCRDTEFLKKSKEQNFLPSTKQSILSPEM